MKSKKLRVLLLSRLRPASTPPSKPMDGWPIRCAFAGSGVLSRLPSRARIYRSALVVFAAVTMAGIPAWSSSDPVKWLDPTIADKRQRWSLRAAGLRGEILRLLASRCRLALVADPSTDFRVGVAVEGLATCRDVVELVKVAQPLPDQVQSDGSCPANQICVR